MSEIVALDLFAGTGWGVACKRLGIEEKAVEIMPEAVATRTANGMKTTYNDVWDGLLLSREMHQLLYGAYSLLIGSPPCQTFSMGGSGSGRRALGEVLEAIELHAYKDPQQLRDFGDKHDPRTALVLAPLAYIWRDMPQFVALEQVPQVLPVWEAYATIMRSWGYSVKTAVLQAEQYGVPQTRKRAILVARLDGAVSLPVPTHSRYYPNNPDKLDAGVQKWVSMAEALGWGHATPSPTIAADPRIAPRGCKHLKPGCCNAYPGTPGRQFPEGTVTVTTDEAAALQTYPVRYTQNNKMKNQAVRTLDQPAPTVTAGHDSGNRGFIAEDGSFTIATPDQVAALQSYPVFRNGNQANAAKRKLDQPAPTIMFGARSNKVEWMDSEQANDPAASGQRVSIEEAATLQSYPVMLRSNYGTSGDPANRGERRRDQPAPTLTSKAARNKWDGEEAMTQDQAAALQTYEEPFVWCGAKSKIFLQIGNAVPPLMAQAVLTALTAESTPAAPRRRRTTRKLV